MKALDAQKDTVTLSIQSEATDKKWRYILWGGVFIVVVLLIMFLVWQGNSKLAEEIRLPAKVRIEKVQSCKWRQRG